MPLAYHVNGPAIVSIGPAGTSQGTLQQLGISEDGVDIVVNAYDEPIFTDKSGQEVPDELQDFGQDAYVRMRLNLYDLNVLRVARGLRGLGGKEGVSPTRGNLVFTSGSGMRLVIASATDEPWRFFFSTLRGPRGKKVGTRKTSHDLAFYCIQRELPQIGPGFWLYDHTAA